MLAVRVSLHHFASAHSPLLSHGLARAILIAAAAAARWTVWSLRTGRLLRRLKCSERPISALASLPAVSGAHGNDGGVCLITAAADKQIKVRRAPCTRPPPAHRCTAPVAWPRRFGNRTRASASLRCGSIMARSRHAAIRRRLIAATRRNRPLLSPSLPPSLPCPRPLSHPFPADGADAGAGCAARRALLLRRHESVSVAPDDDRRRAAAAVASTQSLFVAHMQARVAADPSTEWSCTHVARRRPQPTSTACWSSMRGA